jgi:hypothetical protein
VQAECVQRGALPRLSRTVPTFQPARSVSEASLPTAARRVQNTQRLGLLPSETAEALLCDKRVLRPEKLISETRDILT